MKDKLQAHLFALTENGWTTDGLATLESIRNTPQTYRKVGTGKKYITIFLDLKYALEMHNKDVIVHKLTELDAKGKLPSMA